MAKIIVFGNQKGGVGKTTLTALTAAAFASLKRNVYVADIDKQGSLADSAADAAYTIEKIDLGALLKRLDDLDKKHHYIFIDAAGKLDSDQPSDKQEISKILLFADVLAVPVTPGNFTVAATVEYLRLALLVRAARGASRPLKILLFINQAEPATRDHKELETQLADIGRLTGVDVMRANLPRYASFRAAGVNDSFLDKKSRDRAKNAFSAWFTELKKIADI